MLDSYMGAEDMEPNNLENSSEHRMENSIVSISGKQDEKGPMSLSELSSSFQECFQSNNQNDKTRQPKKAEQPSSLLQLKPFDYEEARKHVKLGENTKHASSQSDGHVEPDDSGNKKKRSTIGQGQTSDPSKQLS